MTQHIPTIDATDPQALAHALEDVERTKTPRLIKRGDKEIAVLSPLKPKRTRKLGRPLTRSDSLFTVIGQAPVADADQVVDNVDTYLAKAYLNQSNSSQEQ
jgi:hypothetical protein